MSKVEFIKVAFIVMLLTALGPLAQRPAHAQTTDPLVTVAIAEAEVEPGDVITVTWEASSHLRRFHHVAIELYHPVLMQPVKVTANARSGSLELTVPDTFYDVAVVEVYPEKSNNQRYKDAANKTIFAKGEVVVDDGVEVVAFTISPNPVERGEPVTVSWEVVAAEGPAPQVSLIYPGEDDFYETESGLPAVGSFTISIAEYYTETFGVSLVAEKTMGGSVQTSLICPFDDYLGEECPIEQSTISLTYQYFEGGLLLQWGDQVFMLRDSPRYAGLIDATTADLSGITPPEGQFLPASAYGGVWQMYRDYLGFALDEPATYQTLLEIHPGYAGRHKALVYWLTLPDEALVSINLMSFNWTVVE